MNQRTFLIPTLSALGMSLTGCTEPIVGDWVVNTHTNGDSTTTYPISESGEAAGYTYSYTASLYMTFTDELESVTGLQGFEDIAGKLVDTYTYTVDDTTTQGGATFDLVGRRESGKTYAIEIDQGEGEDAFELSCTLASSTELVCSNEGHTYVLEQTDIDVQDLVTGIEG